MEKLLHQALDLGIGVLEKEGDVAHIAFNFDHIVEGEMSDDCEGGLSDPGVSFMQILIEVPIIGFDDVWEAMQ